MAVTVTLGAHSPLANRLRAWKPGSQRVGIRVEDGDLTGLEPSVSQRDERGEAGEAAADDRAARVHGPDVT